MFAHLRRVCRSQVLTQVRLLTKSTYGLASAASSAPASSKLLVEKVEKENANQMLHVTWTNDSVNRFPFVYLRDNCLCSECYHESSLQRLYDTCGQLDANIVADQVQVLQDGEQISITWPDKHVSLFDSEWLHARRMANNEDSGNKGSRLNREGVEFWNAEKLQYGRAVPRYDFQELLEDDLTLFKWLNSLHSIGISLVTNTPRRLGENEKLCDRVGYLKTTNYGHRFEVQAKFDANNLAYTTHFLALHTDLAYYNYIPGVQMLHCIEQVPTEGGANQFVDGFHVSQELKNKEPEKFQLLSQRPFQFIDVGKDMFGDYSLKCSHPTIDLDENDQIVRFTFSNFSRDSFNFGSPEKTAALYKAYLTLGLMLRDPTNQIDYKMTPGDMMIFNNSRVLHGRSAFTVTGEGTRFLSGTYLDWDTIYSRMRALSKTHNIPFHL